MLLVSFVPEDYQIPPQFQFLRSESLFWVACGLGALEFILDMIPNVDVWWDRMNGHLRVLVAACLPFVLTPSQSMFDKLFFMVLGVVLSFMVHNCKAGARLAAQEAGTGPIVCPLAGASETCMIGATLFPLASMPMLTVLMLGFMTLIILAVSYVIWDNVKMVMFRMLFLPLPQVQAPASGE